MDIKCLDPDHHYDVAKAVLEFFGNSLTYTESKWCYENALCKEAKLHVMIAEQFCKVVCEKAARVSTNMIENKANSIMGSIVYCDILEKQSKTLTVLINSLKKKAYRQAIIEEMKLICEGSI